MSSFRVLEVITPSKIGGAEVYVADLYEGLTGLGAEVELFCPEGRPFIDYTAGRGIISTSWKTHGKLDPATVIKLARLIKSTGANVIHTHLSTASLLGAFAARFAGVPSVAHVHGLNSATCFKHSTLVIAVSEAVKQHLCRQRIPESKIRVVHNGVDLTKFEPMPISEARKKVPTVSGNPFPETAERTDQSPPPGGRVRERELANGNSETTPLIGVFGRLSPEKGQRFALDAMSILSKSVPNAQMLIVGDGKDRDDLIALAKSLGISDKVRFESFNPDIRPLISACNAVLVPSIKEGFGLVAVNALALERPVVAASVGGLPEIIKHNETGLLVPPGDANAMAQSLAELLSNPDLVSHITRLGRRHAEESFDLTRQIGRVLEVLKEAASL